MGGYRFAGELQRSPIDLMRAGLAFARNIAYPELDIDWYLAQVADLATAARTAVAAGEPIIDQALALARFLFREQAFRGSEDGLADPRNCYLNEMLDRRAGLPISLSVLYLAVAQRLGLEAHGVGAPGHFLVSVPNPDHEELFLDPYYGGRRRSRYDCARLVRLVTGFDGEFRDEWLDPTPRRAILGRMLNNLRLSYSQLADWPHALLAMEHLRLVQPEVSQYLRDLALIHYWNGSLQHAAYYMERYLEQVPEAPDAAFIRLNAAPVMAQWARLN